MSFSRLNKISKLAMSSNAPVNSKIKFNWPTKEQMEYAAKFNFVAPGGLHDLNPHAHVHEIAGNMWMKVFWFVSVPSVILLTIRSLRNHYEELKHVKEHRPEFIPLEYMRIKRNPFPWGDGKRGLFYNPDFVPLPDGYEN